MIQQSSWFSAMMAVYFVARKQTLGHDLFKPGLCLIQFLQDDPQLVDEVGTAFGGSGFGVVWGRSQAATQELLRNVASFATSRKHLRDTSRPGSEVNQTPLDSVSPLPGRAHDHRT
jgi:hypothetical protein